MKRLVLALAIALQASCALAGSPVTINNAANTASANVSGGALNVNVVSGGGTGGTASSFAAAFPATGTAIGVKNGVNMVNLAADVSSNLLVNCAVGCSGGYAQGSTTSGQTGGLNMGAVTTAAPTYTTATTNPLSLTTAGDLRVYDATLAALAAAAVPAGTNIIGKVGIDQTTPGTTNGVVNVASTAGGGTASLAGALSTTVTAIKGSAGNLYMVSCYNPNASVAFVQIFNIVSGSVTLGTSTPTLSIPIAATSTGGFAMSAVPVAFGTAMSWASTTTYNGLTANGSALQCNAVYN